MSWRQVRISRFGGPEVLQLVDETSVPEPGPGQVRIKVLAAGTGFTDAFIRMGRYPDFKGPLPFTPGYDLVGTVEKAGRGVMAPREGDTVADLCVVGGYAQYAIRPVNFLVPVPDGLDASEAVCIPLAYLTAFQMLTRLRRLPAGATILVIGASGTVGAALLDLARRFGLNAIGTCSAANLALVERYGAVAIDYRGGDFVAAVRRLTGARPGGVGVDAAFDAIGGPHFARSFACLVPGGMLVGYGSQTMAAGRESLVSAGLGLLRLKMWGALSPLFKNRSAAWYSITARRNTHPEEFKADMRALFELLRDGAIHPVVVDRLPLDAARDVHARIDAGGLGGKVVLMPWTQEPAGAKVAVSNGQTMTGTVHDRKAMLGRMNSFLDASTYVFVSATNERTIAAILPQALGSLRESEGVTLILERKVAQAAGFDAGLPMRRIVLQVNSALDGVGLTAAVASALAAEAIPCNVVAAFHHDHIFVPSTMAERALATLIALQTNAG